MGTTQISQLPCGHTAPFRLHHLQLPSLRRSFVDREEPPPDPVCAALPGAAAEGWVRFWGQRGCPCHRASPALEMQPHGNIITAKRQKRPVKGCSPRLRYAPARSGLFSRWVLALHGYLSNCWQQAVNIARYSSSRQLLPETRTHGAT